VVVVVAMIVVAVVIVVAIAVAGVVAGRAILVQVLYLCHDDILQAVNKSRILFGEVLQLMENSVAGRFR